MVKTQEQLSRCVLYARVSTAAEKNLQDPEVQLRQLRSFAATQNWQIVGEYIDRESGANPNRPEFTRMLTAASKRSFDVLLFWSLDRFSRQGIVPVLTNLQRLAGWGVKYRSLQEPYIDTTNEWGDLIAAFCAKLAELERKRIQARIRAGIEKARKDGKHIGRKTIVVDRLRIWSLHDADKSVRQIAIAVGLSPTTVQRIIKARRASEFAPIVP
jgi:DNA invertase Pin-like site-specific DNA recombinase